MENPVKKEREYHAKSIRVLKIEKEIQSGTYPSVDKLASLLEVSRRTILRDIQNLMNDYDAPIDYDRNRGGYYYTDNTFFVKNMLISEGELVALAGLLPLLERYHNTPLEESISKVYNTLSQMLPDQVEVQKSMLNDIEFISDPIPTINPEIFTSIFKATKQHKTITFGYRNISATEYTPHTAEPYKIYCNKGDWYFIGWYHKRQSFSTFTLARMKDVTLLGEFKPDPDWQKQVHIDPNLGIWNNDNPPEKIELLFDKAINTYILERTWHKNQECHQNPDGSVYLSFTSNQTQETLYWIMKFGSKVKVLNPPSMVERVKQELKDAGKLYK